MSPGFTGHLTSISYLGFSKGNSFNFLQALWKEKVHFDTMPSDYEVLHSLHS